MANTFLQNALNTTTTANGAKTYKSSLSACLDLFSMGVSSNAKEQIEGKRLLIVDDICAGGRTFKELAQKLKSIANCNIDLYVTHGFFNNSVNVIDSLVDSGISDIHTTHNPYKLKHTRLNDV